MTVSTTPYYHWSSRNDWRSPPFTTCSPNLSSLLRFLVETWGGASLGCHNDRSVAGSSTMSSHAWGAALDWSYMNGRFVGRTKAITVVAPWLVAHSKELGINTIHDYITQSMWKPLVGWRSASIGSNGGTWFHIETTPAMWGDGRTVQTKLRSVPLPPPPPPPPPKFLPEYGVFGLWPLNPAKPQIGPFARGDAVRYLQGVLYHKAGQRQHWVWGTYDGATVEAVDAVQALGQVVHPSRALDIERISKVTGPATWALIDKLATGKF